MTLYAPDKFRDAERLCVKAKRQCNPARDFCLCWWDSDDPGDWDRRYHAAILANAGDGELAPDRKEG